MKTQTVIILAVAAVAAAWIVARAVAARGPATVINQAPDRSDAEQLLTGLGNLLGGVGDAAEGVARALTPNVVIASRASSGG